jgi:hypothetical protein
MISSIVAVMFSLALVAAAQAFSAVARRPERRRIIRIHEPREDPAPERAEAEPDRSKIAMLSFMGRNSDLKKGALKPRLKRVQRALLDDNVFRAAELNRARLCTIFCVAMSTQPVMDRAETLLGHLFRAGDQGEWEKLLSLFVYLSWGPILDTINRNALERERQKDSEVSMEFDPLNINKEKSKVRRRMESIERQFERPAKIAIFFYLLELVFADTSVLRESRMAITELRNVVMHDGDLHVLLEKSAAACLQVGCNVSDIGHDVDSISNKFVQFLPHFDHTVRAD